MTLLAAVWTAALPVGTIQLLDADVAPGEGRLLWLDIAESFTPLPVRQRRDALIFREDGISQNTVGWSKKTVKRI